MKDSWIYRASPWIALALALFVALKVASQPSDDSDVPNGEHAPRTLRLAAASSLASVMGEAVARWNEATGDEVEVVPGASSTLARQIQNGAPYDVFVSAHVSWMNALVAGDLVDAAEVAPIAHNSLVVIARLERGERDGDRSRPFEPALFVPSHADGARWALGDPAHVPAGVYAKEALVGLGVWDSIEPRVVPAADVGAALRLVQRGEVEYGIVYRTDVPAQGRLTVVAEVPLSRHTRASVVAGPIRGAQEGADLLSAWLRGPIVRALLRSSGFRVEGP